MPERFSAEASKPNVQERLRLAAQAGTGITLSGEEVHDLLVTIAQAFLLIHERKIDAKTSWELEELSEMRKQMSDKRVGDMGGGG